MPGRPLASKAPYRLRRPTWLTPLAETARIGLNRQANFKNHDRLWDPARALRVRTPQRGGRSGRVKPSAADLRTPHAKSKGSPQELGLTTGANRQGPSPHDQRGDPVHAARVKTHDRRNRAQSPQGPCTHRQSKDSTPVRSGKALSPARAARARALHAIRQGVRSQSKDSASIARVRTPRPSVTEWGTHQSQE